MQQYAWNNFIALVLLSGFVPPLTAKSQEEPLADLIERAEKSVVRIEVQGRDGPSLGSGFIVDDQGTMITNCHVLAGAREATIHFPNGDEGRVLGTFAIDETRDIAVTRIDRRDAPPLSLAAQHPRKGETVTALGSPHGLSFTATNGIVSAIRPGEEIAEDIGKSGASGDFGTWIQVDAAISPGNSGGPLINRKGEVVAMCTLASQGSAQNLNFGISASDINELINTSVRRGQITSLRDGAAKVRMSQPTGGGPSSPIAGGSVPSGAIADYIKNGQSEYSDLVRGLRMESARLSADLKEMKKGFAQIPRGLRSNETSVVVVPVPGKKEKRWYFRNQVIKDEVLEVQQQRVRDYMKIKNQLRSSDDSDSMFELLWNYGPPLNTRKNQSVGFVTDLFVVRPFNDHEVLASLDGKPYLVWLNSTAGLAGGEILSGPTFVAGTVSVQFSDGLPAAITVLREITKDELRAAIDDEMPKDIYRTWKDNSGSYTVEAKLLGQDTNKVVLQKRDGSIVNVPKSRLSSTDQSYLKNQ
ncbi:MAG: trypsin-like peptidase domain-containing protein [Planctomycetota bacterium]